MNYSEIIGTGLTGLVGSRVAELNPHFNFTDISYPSFDISKIESIEPIFRNSSAQTVVHLAAFTDTAAAWDQRGDKSAPCYQINVVGTENIAKLCRKYNKYLVHISTDFIFNGQKETPYFETDLPQPIDWYGETKAMAEDIVTNSQIPASIVRIAYPYRSSFPSKIDLIRKIKEKLENKQTVTMFSDQIITPTFIDDIAIALNEIITRKPEGIYHLVGSSSQSPYELASKIASTFNLDPSLIKGSSLKEYLKTPGIRPYSINGALSNQKFISEFNIRPKTVTEGIQELKRQLG